MSLSLSTDSRASNPGPEANREKEWQDGSAQTPQVTWTEGRGPRQACPYHTGPRPSLARGPVRPTGHTAQRCTTDITVGPSRAMGSQVGASRTLHSKPRHGLGATGTAKPELRRSPSEVAGGTPTLPTRVSSPRASYTPAGRASVLTEPVLTRFQAGSTGARGTPLPDNTGRPPPLSPAAPRDPPLCSLREQTE